MASVVEKLYPPTIGSSIPAFYSENGTAVLAVPFSMNKAVDVRSISGFSLKIKTAQTNSYVKTLKYECVSTDELTSIVDRKIIYFTWDNFNSDNEVQTIKYGQFLKVQIAYLDITGAPGYFSTVGITKYTAKPSVEIEGAFSGVDRIEAFKRNYVGIYTPSAYDKSERPYSYCFFLYDKNKQLVESSNWRLHNVNTEELLELNKTIDTYLFEYSLEPNETYYIQYGVRTINNLEIYTPLYPCIDSISQASTFAVNLKAENIFEEGYVSLTFDLQDDYTFLTDEELKSFYHATTIYTTTQNGDRIKTLYDENGELIKTVKAITNSNFSIEICRAELTNNYSTWRILKRIYFDGYSTALNWEFKDFSIEQGITYQYAFRQYNEQGIYSSRITSNVVYADFEDMFLYDGKKQVKIRFNPKVPSFKTNRLEQKVDTIGNKYPFIFKNGIVDYKEFPIGGLISYLADNNELFINSAEDLNIVFEQNTGRRTTPVNQTNVPSVLRDWEYVETLNSLGYNMRAERVFKMKLLDWLNNGEVKLFKSAAEGNFLIRLMNVSLTPEDRLGRMIHSFTATAYEMGEITYNNLLQYNIINLDEDELTTIISTTIQLRDLITSTSQSIKINKDPIVNRVKIELSPNPMGNQIYLRIGEDNIASRTLISSSGFVLESPGTTLPNVYFNPQDNARFLTELNLEQLQDLVSDITITYDSVQRKIASGQFDKIDTIYIKNYVETLIGPVEKNFVVVETSEKKEETLKVFSLYFKKKDIQKLVFRNGQYYDPEQNYIINRFDVTVLYETYDAYNVFRGLYYAINETTLVHVDDNEIDTSIELTSMRNDTVETYDFKTTPIINFDNNDFNKIKLGNGVYCDCAYQVKVNEYTEG